MKNLLIVFTVAVSFLSGSCMGQDQSVIFFNYVDKLPPALLSSNTAVLFTRIDFLGGEAANKAPQNSELIDQLHKSFQALGISPVIYIIQDPLLASQIVTKTQIFDTLKALKTENIIMYSFMPIFMDGKMILSYNLQIAKFNGTASLFSNNQEACKVGETDYEKLIKVLSKKIEKSKLAKRSVNVIAKPNVLALSGVARGEKFNVYPADAKTAKLLVYQHEAIELPAKGPSDNSQKGLYDSYKTLNEEVPRKNEKLTRIITASKLKCELISATTDIKAKEGPCYLVLPMITRITEEKQRLRTDYRWVTDVNGNNTFQNTAHDYNRSERQSTIVFYVYYYLQSTKTGDIYFVDYGDYTDPDKSLGMFLDKISSTVK